MPLTRTPLASHETAGIIPRLSGVSETMLWALHHRASEATRPDGVLADPDSARIRAAIDYDFVGRFGTPAGSLGARAAAIDGALRHWLIQHPDGVVVSLGEGLETQARRVDNGQMRWLSVDLPEAICLRERFLPPTDRFRHVAVSALDEAWMDAVDPSASVFVVAQGLLMYLEPTQVRQLFIAIATRFPGAEMVFDVVPRWFANLTLKGLNQTARTACRRCPGASIRTKLRQRCVTGTPTLPLSPSSTTGCPAGCRYCSPRWSRLIRCCGTRCRAS